MQSNDDFQTQVLERLNELKGDIAQVDVRLTKLETDVDTRLTKLGADFEVTNIKFDAYVKASDRLLGVATTIIITAGTVTILSPFVQSVAPAIRAFLGSSAG